VCNNSGACNSVTEAGQKSIWFIELTYSRNKAQKPVKIFINYLQNYGKTSDTEILYPKNLLKLANYIDIDSSVNNSIFQPSIQKFIRRIKLTRFQPYFAKIPHDLVLIPTSQVSKYDLVYNSYIYPKYIGKEKIPPNLLRINWQTDHVLRSRGISDIQYERKRFTLRWKAFDAIMTTTRFSVTLIEKECCGLVKHIYYCPYFLPYLQEISGEKFTKKINESSIKLLFVGRDGVRKGLDELVLALSQLESEISKAIELTIVSETEFNQELIKDIKFKVFKSLPNSEIMRLMEEAHIFCLPTKSEAYGIVFIEAMSKGCAIISDNDLPRIEIIKNNQTGICVNPENIVETTSALTKLILDRHFRENCMNKSLKTYRNDFSPEVVARRHQQIFEVLINN
jgi:glycosyltransferase involved in cell wall biosynthesis